MDWIDNNWIWLLFLVGMVAMHVFGHRGHRYQSRQRGGPDPGKPARTDETPIGHDHAGAPQASVAIPGADRAAIPVTTPPNGHRHVC